MKTSEKLIRELSIVKRKLGSAECKLYCGNLSRIGLQYSDVQRDRMRQAEQHLDQARSITREVFSKIIGDEILKEIGL